MLLLELQYVLWFLCDCAMTIASKPDVPWQCGDLLLLFLSLPLLEGRDPYWAVVRQDRTGQDRTGVHVCVCTIALYIYCI